MEHYNQTSEQQAWNQIDRKLVAAGWVILDKNRLNLYAFLGVAVREMDTDTGPADYMLFVDGKASGIIEAKREGTSLGKLLNNPYTTLPQLSNTSNALPVRCETLFRN